MVLSIPLEVTQSGNGVFEKEAGSVRLKPT
jgi:hypothetical protein